MAKFVSEYAGKLELPDGTEVFQGDSFEVDKALAENAGIKSWVDGGLIKESAPAKK